MVLENHSAMLQVSSSNSHSSDKKVNNTVYQKPWMKLMSPVAESPGEVFFRSGVVVCPEIVTAVNTENNVGEQEVNKSNGTQKVEYSVKADVFSTAVTQPQQETKSGDAELAEATSGVTPEAVPTSTIVIAGTPGAKKYIKVLRAYRIVLIGKNGNGKSSLGNSIFGEDVFKLSGTNKCQIQSKSVHERRITLIDTPGFSETDQPEEHLKDYIVRCTTECATGPHAFLIVLKVEESTEEQQAVIDKIQQYFSEELFKYASVVFTHGDWLHEGVNIEQYVSQNTRLSDLVKKCGGRYHVVNNKCKLESDENKFQMSQILNTVDKIVMENKGGCYISQMPEVQKRENSKTLAEKQPQEENGEKGNSGPRKNMWVSLSGPAGMSVANAFFGPTVTVWQKTTRVAVNEENKLTDEEEVNEDAEATTESEPEESSKPTDDASDQNDEKPKSQSGKQDNGKQEDKTEHEKNSFPSINWLWAAATGTLAALAAGAAGLGLALTALGAGLGAIVGGIAAAGIKGAIMAGVKKIVLILATIGTAIAAVKIGLRIKNIIVVLLNLYNTMKENLGVILLVVGFGLLLVATFFARVPMAGTLLLSGSIVFLFLLIMFLVAFIK